jgi:hypothetical protein
MCSRGCPDCNPSFPQDASRAGMIWAWKDIVEELYDIESDEKDE